MLSRPYHRLKVFDKDYIFTARYFVMTSTGDLNSISGSSLSISGFRCSVFNRGTVAEKRQPACLPVPIQQHVSLIYDAPLPLSKQTERISSTRVIAATRFLARPGNDDQNPGITEITDNDQACVHVWLVRHCQHKTSR